MSAHPYRWEEDAMGCYAVALAALREQGVREGRFEPQDDRERRQAAEGPRDWPDIEAGRV